LVNARLSERSARRYARFAGFTRATLRELAGVAAQTEADARRLTELGALEAHVSGNIKFDRAPRPQDLELGKRLRSSFGGRPVFLAASTREGEEQQVLAAVEACAAKFGGIDICINNASAISLTGKHNGQAASGVGYLEMTGYDHAVQLTQ
jgi:3-deoxy-D-manno-octulosonic-acid transferase